jgi:hypothetical protein
MKHLLNGMPEWEKNSIREQHEGGMSIDTSKFKKLMESKLGNVKPLITEALAANAGEIQKFLQLNQDNTLVADYKFGNKSAIAAGKYLFLGTGKENYNTVTNVKTLWAAMLANGLDVGDTSGFGPKMAKALAAALETSKTSISQTKTVAPVAPVGAPAAPVGAPAAPVKPVVPLLAYRPGYGPNAPADSTSVNKNNLLIDPFKKPSTPVYTNQFTFSQK